MNISIDLVLILINLLALAYSYGRFSEKINNLEEKLSNIADTLTKLNSMYFTSKEGGLLENQIKTMWKKLDEHPCKRCTNFKDSNEGHS